MAKLNLSRDQLGAFLGKDHKAIVQFENLFTETNNIEGTYLPLAGGTLTGQLIINYGIDGTPGLRVKATAVGGDGMTFENSSGAELMAVDADSNNNIDFDLKDDSSNSILKVNTTSFAFNTGVQEIDLDFYKKTSGKFMSYDSSLDILDLQSDETTITGDTTLDLVSTQVTITTGADKALLSTQSTGTVDLAIPTTKYVNDNDFWDRASSTLNPRTSTDAVEWDEFRYQTATLGFSGNTLIGENGPSSVNSISNTAVGNAAFAGGTGNQSTAVGFQAMQTSSSNPSNSAAFGAYALKSATSGTNNAAGGMSSLQSLTTGGNNTAWGYQSGLNHTTASGCVYLGYQAGYSNNTDNLLIIENSTNVTTPLIWGNFSTNALTFNCATDLALLQNQPTGGTDLAICTTKYTDDGVQEAKQYALLVS